MTQPQPPSIEPELPSICFYDEFGCAWHAREVDGASVPGSHGLRCLIIESLRAVKRVWRFPVEWRALPRDGLIALLAAR